MQTIDSRLDEARELRRTLREVVALSTLPAVWAGCDRRGVAESLADVLVNTLSLDLVYIRLRGPGGLEVARGRRRPEIAGRAAMIGEALAPFLKADTSDAPALVPDPMDGGALRVMRFGLGQADEEGLLIAGSRQPGFPSESDRVLLGVGANQATIVIQRTRAEEKVQESERRLREMIDALPAAIYTTDAEGRLTHFNPACVEFSGRVPELGNDNWCVTWKLYYPDGRPMPHDECPMAIALKEGRAVRDAEAIAERQDGKRIWFMPYPTPLRDADDRIVGGINMLVDISERKQAEAALRRSEQELADFFDNASVGLHWVGPDGIILRVNQAELELLGYSREAYVGHHIAEFHVDQTVIADILRRLSAGETLRDCEARMRCKDGSIKHVLIDSSVMWQDGTFIHTRCFTRDVTQQKRAERLQQESEERFRSLVHATSQVVWTTDADGRVVKDSASWRAFTGQTYDEWKEWGWLDAIHPDDRHRTAQIWRQCVKDEYICNTEYRLRTADGSYRWTAVRAVPVREPDGRVREWIGTNTDITDRKQAEEALRKSEERYRRLVALLPVAVYTCEAPSGIITFYNDHAAALWGRAPHIGDTDERFCGSFRLWRPDGTLLPHDQTPMAQAICEGRSFRNEDVVIERPDGSRINVLVNIDPVRDADGRVVGAINAFHDTTALKAAQEALRESETRLRLAQSAARIGTFDWNLQTGVNRWTPELEAIYGLKPGDFGGTQPAFERLVHPDDLPGTVAKAEQAIQSGEPTEHEWRIIWPDGSVRWVAGRFQCFKDALGKPLRLSGINIDITKRKQADQTSRFLADASASLAELTDYESTLQRIAALAVPAFADWCAVDIAQGDGSLRRLAVTHSDPAKVALAHELFRRYPPQPSDPHGAMRVLRTGESEWSAVISDSLIEESANDEDHLRIIRQLGLKSFICAPLRLRERTLGVLTFVTAESGRFYDATDLAVAEDLARRAAIAIENANLLATLKESDRRKDEFLATLAHELRNPLAPVRNAVQLLRLKGSDEPELRWGRDVIDRQVEHLTRLIDDLLDISRITCNKLELRKQRIELAEVINGAVESSRPAIEECGHELTVSLPPQPVYLNGDLVRLAQVFLNLLNNAAKYTERGGRIWLTVEQQASEVVVRVKDTGVGIPAEKLSGLFEMFFQVDRTLERSQGGLGIGLSLVRRLVELHGGRVEARSEGAGKGSEFIVRLPVLAEKPAHTQSHQPSGNGEKKAFTALRILVVDDNRDAADSLAMLLRLTGNEVRTGYDGLEGVNTAERFRPDVVLLDIGMPKLNGCEACRRIREQPWGKDAVLIALTGWGQDEDRRRTVEAGFDAHMVKPVDPTALLKLLASLAVEGGRLTKC